MDDKTGGHSKPKIPKEPFYRSPTIMVLIPMIIALQLGWVYLRGKYIPPEERRSNALLDRVLKFVGSTE